MQPDDQFRRAFERTAGDLAAWAARQNDCAAAHSETVGDFFRLSLAPYAANACPVELILHRATQSYDIQIGPETYEGRPIGDLDWFLPLLEAVVAGTVITRSTTSGLSGAALSVETQIRRADGSLWRAERHIAGTGRADVVVRDRHWLAYRR